MWTLNDSIGVAPDSAPPAGGRPRSAPARCSPPAGRGRRPGAGNRIVRMCLATVGRIPSGALPGDDIFPAADVVTDRAFTLPAPPAQVGPWFVELGERRAGWYLPPSV